MPSQPRITSTAAMIMVFEAIMLLGTANAKRRRS